MRRYGLALAGAIALLVNAVVLARVAWNRSGEPDAVVTLTERELTLASMPPSREDSGVALRFDSSRYDGQVLPDDHDDDATVVDAGKLASLGFDVRVPEQTDEASRVSYRELPRRAFAVLESDGARWAGWKRRVEARLATLDGEVASGQSTVEEAKLIRESAESLLRSGSRLFIVDVGLDADALRRQHPDRRAHFILPALVRPRLTGHEWKKPCRPPECRLVGSVSLLSSELDVARSLQGPLLERVGSAATPPRYQVDLSVGRSHQPWITAIRPLAAPR